MTLYPILNKEKWRYLSHLFVLVGGDTDEDRLDKDKGPELAPGKLENVVGLDDVETRLVLVHRIQYGLLKKEKKKGEENI